MRLSDVELDGSDWGMRWPGWEFDYQRKLQELKTPHILSLAAFVVRPPTKSAAGRDFAWRGGEDEMGDET
jgi:hypothetical protein